MARYFSKQKFMEWWKSTGYYGDILPNWVYLCDGKIVTNGYCSTSSGFSLYIRDEWMIEKED